MIKKKCSNILCNEMLPRSKQPPYCDEHDPTPHSNKQYDLKQRDERSKKFYSSIRWQRFRLTVLNEYHWLCQMKLDDCKVTADTVHHIVEVRDSWNKRFKRENVIPVCVNCHMKHHKERK